MCIQKEGAKTADERFVVVFQKSMSPTNTQHPGICYPSRVATVGAWFDWSPSAVGNGRQRRDCLAIQLGGGSCCVRCPHRSKARMSRPSYVEERLDGLGPLDLGACGRLG